MSAPPLSPPGGASLPVASRFIDVDSTIDNFTCLSGLADIALLPLLDTVYAMPAEIAVKLNKPAVAARMYAEKKKKKGTLTCTVQLISTDQIAAIHLYTQETPLYGELNRLLRSRSRASIRPFLPYMKLLLSGLYCLPLRSGSVWRGVARDELPKYDDSIGDSIVWWGFSSCTISIKQTELFLIQGLHVHADSEQAKLAKKTLFHLEIRSGVDIKEFSAIPTEDEVLVMPGTVLQVIGTSSLTSIVHLRESPMEPLLDFVHPLLLAPTEPQNFKGVQVAPQAALSSAGAFMSSAAGLSADDLYTQAIVHRDGKVVPKDLVKAVELFDQAAKMGHKEAQNEFGLALQFGHGVAKDEHKAVELFRRGVEMGNAKAKLYLGRCYSTASATYTGVEKDDMQAFSLFEQATAAGDVHAKIGVSYAYAFSLGVPKDRRLAVKLLRECIDAGSLNAMFQLALFYHHEGDVDHSQAFALYQRAAEAGHPEAQDGLAICYRDGIGVKKNINQAIKWWNKSAESGLSNAMVGLAQCYRDGDGVAKDLSRAFSLFQQTAAEGSIRAQNDLGMMYLEGLGVKKNARIGAQWLKKAADAGYRPAQYNMGTLYKAGDGVPLDNKLAFSWLQKAADQGCSFAHAELAHSHRFGLGVPINLRMTFRCYKKAAELENESGPDSLCNLALCYRDGVGTPKDSWAAQKLLEGPATEGNERAKQLLASCV